MKKSHLYIVGVIVLLVLSALLHDLIIREEVDAIYVNGTVYTMDEQNSTVEAIAIKNQMIVGIGSRSAIERKFKSRTTVDLEGKTVLPGLIDAHAHLLSLGVSKLTVELLGTTSADEICERVKERVRESDPGLWIRGRGWDQNDWEKKEFPNYSLLDKVAPGNPVYLTRIDGHAAWVNKRALDIAGITRETPDPSGGRLIRDKKGNPTGVLIDAAMRLVSSKLPDLSEEEATEALALAVAECVKVGLTSVQDMGVDLRVIDLYKKAIDQQLPMVRIYAAIGGTGATWDYFLKEGPLVNYGKNFLTIRAIKLYIDGALGSRGAALVEPYSDDPSNRGLTLVSDETLLNNVEEALRNRFQVCTHAIGDRGNHIVLNSYEKALSNVPTIDPRLRIEHAQVVLPEDIPRFHKLGVLPSMQPTHCTSDMYWAEARVGPERVKGAYAWRSFRDAGSIIPGGSDFPVELPNPMHGIYAAVTRRDLEGRPIDAEDVRNFFQLSERGIVDESDFAGGWYAKEKLTRLEAIRMFTSWAAYGAFEESIKGSLEKGKVGDFIVLSKDIMNVPESEISTIEILRTVIGGQTVYTQGQDFK